MGVLIPGQVDPRGAEFGQHYELFNERVIATAAVIASGRATAATLTSAKPLPPHAFGAIMTFRLHVPVGEPVRGRLSPEHALR